MAPFELNVQWPEPGVTTNAKGLEQPIYQGTVVFYTTVTIPKVARDATMPEAFGVAVDVYFQACASQCIFPDTVTLEASIALVEKQRGVTLPNILNHSVFAGYNPDGGDRALPMEEPDLGESAAVFTESNGGNDAGGGAGQSSISSSANSLSIPFLGKVETKGLLGTLIAVLLALVGGTVLNLMPCVLPIIPIKIMGLTQASGSRGKSTFLGFMMLLGVTSLWLVIGIAIVQVKGFDSVSSLFQEPLFGIGVGLFILLMGIGMMGLFTVQLPQFVYRVNPKHDSPVGAFGFGVMAAILSTPCTAPFMGASISWATKQESSNMVLAVFIAIGIGMGWPYLVLAAFPKLVEKIPRTGPASEVVKHVLGLLMIAAAVFFTGAGVLGLLKMYPFLGPVLYWWLTTAVIAVMAFWLIYRTFQITPSAVRRIVFSVIAIVLLGGMGSFAISQTKFEHFKHTSGLWGDYSDAAFDEARDDGSIVIVDFTAVW